MVKYDEGFKQRVVHAYLAGEGSYVSVAKRLSYWSNSKYDMLNNSCLP